MRVGAVDFTVACCDWLLRRCELIPDGSSIALGGTILHRGSAKQITGSRFDQPADRTRATAPSTGRPRPGQLTENR